MGLPTGDPRAGKRDHPWRRRAGISAFAMVLLLIGARIALEPLLLRYANRHLDGIPDYRGHIDEVDVQLLRGAYRLEGITLEKVSGKVPVPFFKARSADISVEWPALLRKAFVAEIEVEGAEVNFVAPPPKSGPRARREQGQLSIDPIWTDQVEELSPIRINRFRIREGRIHYRDFHRSPEVDIHLDHIEAEATGLTNARRQEGDLPAEFHATGRAMGHGSFRLDMRLAPLAEAPTFDLDAELTGLRLTTLNDFFAAYAGVDVEGGSFDLFTEAAAADGRFKGYLKPVIKDLQVLGPRDEGENIFKLAWEAVVAGLTELLENQPKERTAAVIPFSGPVRDPKAGIWATAGSLLRNAFVEALRPSLSGSIGPEDVK